MDKAIIYSRGEKKAYLSDGEGNVLGERFMNEKLFKELTEQGVVIMDIEAEELRAGKDE